MWRWIDKYKVAVSVLAPTLAMVVAAISLYGKYAAASPAIVPAGIVLTAERDLAARVVRTGDLDAIRSADTARMTSRAVVLLRFESLRDDCVLASRLVVMRNLSGEQYVLGAEVLGMPETVIGERLAMVVVRFPSNILPGDYFISASAIYTCDGAETSYVWPTAPVEVTY